MRLRNKTHWLPLVFTSIVFITISFCSVDSGGDMVSFEGLRILIHVEPKVQGPKPYDTTFTDISVSFKDKSYLYDARYQIVDGAKDSLKDLIITLTEKKETLPDTL